VVLYICKVERVGVVRGIFEAAAAAAVSVSVLLVLVVVAVG
jgi:hypothetical protein